MEQRDDARPSPSPGLDPQGGGNPPFDPHLLNQADPEPVPSALMGHQPFLHDQNLGSISGADPNLLLPIMAANGSAPVQLQPDHKTVSADDIALYDRQIRLWGMAAQARIQNANILLITIRALANEVAKNLVLAGIGSLTLLDSSTVAEADLGAQFLLAEAGDSVVGQKRAEAACAGLRKLNPRVQIHVDTEGVIAKGPGYFAGYDVVIATDLDPDSFNIINTATRINGKAFYAAGTHGMYGFIFSDLIEHDYVIERTAGNVPTKPMQETRTRSVIHVKTKGDNAKTVESVTKRELYSTWFLASDLAVLPDEYVKPKRRLKNVTPALSCFRALWDFKLLKGGALPSNREDLKLFTQIATQKHKALSLPSETLRPEFLRSFLQNLGCEIAPVAAILGGQLAQDVINVLGQTQQPIQNMVIFDGDRMEAAMFPLHPEGALGAGLLSLAASNGGSITMDPVMGRLPGLGEMGMSTGGAGLAPVDGPSLIGASLDANAAGMTIPSDDSNAQQTEAAPSQGWNPPAEKPPV